jgi:hypothetical protein
MKIGRITSPEFNNTPNSVHRTDRFFTFEPSSVEGEADNRIGDRPRPDLLGE